MPYSQQQYEALRDQLTTKLLYCKSDCANAEAFFDALTDPTDFFAKLNADTARANLLDEYQRLLSSHQAYVATHYDRRRVEYLADKAAVENPPLESVYDEIAGKLQAREVSILASR